MPKVKSRALGYNKPFVTVPGDPKVSASAPGATDRNYELGQLWIREITADTRSVYIFGGLDSSGNAIWNISSPGASDVDTLTGDAGGAISPAGGNITLAGGTNIASTGAGSTITFNLDPAITLATSVTSPLYTVAAATDLAVTGVAGQNVVFKTGDNAGANKFSFLDSDDVEVFSIDSNGGLPTIAGALTVSGLFTANGSATIKTAGTALNLGTDNAAGAVNIGTGTTIRAIGIANAGGVAHTVAIGSASAGAMTIDTAAGISLDGATASNFTVTGASQDLTLSSSGGSINITATESAADAIVMNASGAAGGVQIKAGTGGVAIGNEADTTTIGVGDFAPTAARTITIGGGVVVTASVTDTIDIAPDGATTNADSIKTLNLNAGGVTTGQVLTNIATGAITSGTHTVSIQTGNAAAGTVATNISTGTGTKSVTVGNADGLTTTGIKGPINLNASQNSNTAINSGTSTGTVTVGNGAAGAITVDTAAGISLDAATASNFTVTGAADLTLTSTAGSIPITAGEADAAAIALQAAAGGLDIDTGLAIIADAAGNIELNSSAGQILIGNDAVNQNMSFGSAGARTVTVGSTTGASALVLQSGTGKTTMTGRVEQIDVDLIGKYGIYIPSFNMNAQVNTAANTGGAATGATGDINNVSLQDGSIMNAFVIGAGQTILQPIMGANGLIVNGDKTNTEGYEYNFGVQSGKSFGFTVGTSAAFFFELGLYINDMDGAAPYIFGFRKVEANNATFANYTDYYAMGMNAGTSATQIVIYDELNSGGQTISNTGDNWGGDGSTNTLKILVSAAGVVTATINGSAPSVPRAFTFDNGDYLIPFLRFEHSASATDVAITSMRIGFQA